MKQLHRMEGFWAGVVAIGLAVPAQAALHGRLPTTAGGTDYQAYYDDVLDVTWTADANLAASKTFGLAYNTDLGDYPGDSYGPAYTEQILADGRMGWGAALHWIGAMNTANYLGQSDWRLPSIVDVGNDGCNFSYTSTDCGYNVLTGSAATTVYSELASLYSDTLGNSGIYDTLGNDEPEGWGLANTGPFANLDWYFYWSGTAIGKYPAYAWFFAFGVGNQDLSLKYNGLHAWAVRSGDVAVPEPASLGLAGTALGGLLGVSWRRRRR